MTSRTQTQTPTASDAVKGRITTAGLKYGDLAAEAGISQPAMSLYLSGARSNYETQIRIHDAFCRLTGRRPTRRSERWFWGSLLNRVA